MPDEQDEDIFSATVKLKRWLKPECDGSLVGWLVAGVNGLVLAIEQQASHSSGHLLQQQQSTFSSGHLLSKKNP